MAIEVEVVSKVDSANSGLKSVEKNLDNLNKKAISVKDIKINTNTAKSNAQLKELATNVSAIKLATDKAAGSIRNMAMSLGALVASAVSLTAMTRFTDSVVEMHTKMKLATKSAAEFGVALSDIKKISLSTRTSLSDISDLYMKISMSAGDLGVTQKQTAVVTQTVAKAIALSGANADQASAAILQLGQALASGRLQGDELRSLGENASVLYRAIAKGLGYTIGQMRTLGGEGKLTSKEVFGALLKQSSDINKNFNNVNTTFSQAFTNINTSSTLLFERVFLGKGASGGSQF